MGYTLSAELCELPVDGGWFVRGEDGMDDREEEEAALSDERESVRSSSNTKACRAARCFGKRLRAWRIRMGLPLKRVAGHLGVSISIVCAWEQARRFPNICHLERISAYTGMAIGQLLCERTEPSPGDFACPEAMIEVDRDGTILGADHLRSVAAETLLGSSIFSHVDGDGQAQLRTAFRKVQNTGKAVVGEIAFGALSRGERWLSRVAPISRHGSTHKFLVVATDMSRAPLLAMDTRSIQEQLNDKLCDLSDRLRSASFQLQEFRRAMGRTLDTNRLSELGGIASELNACKRLLAGARIRKPTPVEVFATEEQPPGDLPL